VGDFYPFFQNALITYTIIMKISASLVKFGLSHNLFEGWTDTDVSSPDKITNSVARIVQVGSFFVLQNACSLEDPLMISFECHETFKHIMIVFVLKTRVTSVLFAPLVRNASVDEVDDTTPRQ